MCCVRSYVFENNTDEQLIMRQTGHHSGAVRNYKRPSVQHDQLVSSVLQPPPPPSTSYRMSAGSCIPCYNSITSLCCLFLSHLPSMSSMSPCMSESWKPPPNFSLPQHTQHHLSVSSVLEPPPSESVKHELGVRILCRHKIKHNRPFKASSIMLAL